MSYTFQKGETIKIGLEAVEGDVDDVVSIVAKIKNNRTGEVYDLNVDEILDPPGWVFSRSSADLELGEHTADATTVVGSEQITTDPITVKITPSVSGV